MVLLSFMAVSYLLAFSDGILQLYKNDTKFQLTMAARAQVQDKLTSLIGGIQPRYVYNAGCSFGSKITALGDDKKSIQLNLFFYAPDLCGPQFKSTVRYATGQDLQDMFKPLVKEVLELLDNLYPVGYVVSGQFQLGYSVEQANTGCTTLIKNVTAASEAHCYGFDSILMARSAFDSLYAGCQLESPNKKYVLKMTLGCKLLLIEAATNITFWSAPYSEAGHSGCFLVAQGDWNLVVYNGSHAPLWASGSGFFQTQGGTTPGTVWLEVGSNRGLALYLTVNGVKSIWTTGTAVDDTENATDDNGITCTVFPCHANVTDVSNTGESKIPIIVWSSVLPLAIILLSLLFTVLIWQHRRLKRVKVEAKILKSMAQSQLRNFSFKTLESATQRFHPSNKLGQGGHGAVYKGIIPTVGTVAIKQLQFLDEGQVDFLNEVSTISSLQHKNLIKMIGFCYERNHRLLVYEYLVHNSLHHALHGTGLHLPWNSRYRICLGVAKGIAYLHEESRTRVVHRDIKATNILLDKDLNARISDFGLAKFMRDSATHISTRVAGTFGYLAPEYALYGQVTEKVDVYSFGILGLELISGRENMDFGLPPEQAFILEWAWRLHEHGQWMYLVDKKLIQESNTVDELHRVFMVSLLCTQAESAARPSMSRVVGMLTGDIQLKLDISRPGFLPDLKEAARNNVSR